jgi:hypothetical protein
MSGGIVSRRGVRGKWVERGKRRREGKIKGGN